MSKDSRTSSGNHNVDPRVCAPFEYLGEEQLATLTMITEQRTASAQQMLSLFDHPVIRSLFFQSLAVIDIN